MSDSNLFIFIYSIQYLSLISSLSLLVIINICLHLSVNNFLTLSISGKCCLQVYERTFIIIRFILLSHNHGHNANYQIFTWYCSFPFLQFIFMKAVCLGLGCVWPSSWKYPPIEHSLFIKFPHNSSIQIVPEKMDCCQPFIGTDHKR